MFVGEDTLLKMNADAFNDSQGRRFGYGKVVARIPLNVFFQQFPKRLQDGDADFTKWWLNQERNRVWRTFRGVI